MTAKGDKSATISKGILDWLTRYGGIASILAEIFSSFFDNKPAKQFAYGSTLIIWIVTLWYQNRRTDQLKIAEPRSTDAANRLFERYLALYKEDRGTRIPFRRARWIQRYASPKVKNEGKAKELLNKSNLAFFANVGTNVTVGFFFIVIFYAFLKTDFLFNPIAYAFGRDQVQQENPFIPLSKDTGYMIFGSEATAAELDFGEQPKQTIPIQDFAIQKTEVTNHQFQVCRRAGGCSSDPVIRQDYENSDHTNYPVIQLTAPQAQEFCHWLGGDLPTNEEWERAARGLSGNLWPWGDDPPSYITTNLPSEGFTPEGLKSVGGFPKGASSEGVLDLAGNVWEWTRTVLECDENNSCVSSEWDGKDNSAALVVRGGAWNFQLQRITQVLEVTAVQPEYSAYDFFGFRCVKPTQP